MATEGVHPFVGPWWPPGHIFGYEHTFVHAVYELMRAINTKPTIMPDFRDGRNAWRCSRRSRNRRAMGVGEVEMVE